MEIPEGGGGGEYYEAPWNGKSWGGGGSNLKKPSVGGGAGYGYFQETTQFILYP